MGFENIWRALNRKISSCVRFYFIVKGDQLSVCLDVDVLSPMRWIFTILKYFQFPIALNMH